MKSFLLNSLKLFYKLSRFEKYIGGGTAGCVIAANGGIRSGSATNTGKLDKNENLMICPIYRKWTAFSL